MWRRPQPAVAADPTLMGLLVDAFGPLEPNLRSPLAVILCVLCWELLYRVSQLACVVLAPVVVRAGHAKGATAFRNNGCTYVVAFVHALLTGGRGLWHIWSLLGAPLDDKLATSLDPLSPFHAAAVATEFTGLLFLSWLIYDIVHVLTWWPVLGGADTIAHHVGFAVAASLASAHRALPFQFAWLITGEMSSPFLNIRWFLIHSGRGDSVWMSRTNLAFGLTFFVVRVVLYTLGLAHMALAAPRILELQVLPTTSLAAIALLLCGGYALNLMWASKIWAMAMGKKKGGKKALHDEMAKQS